MSTSGHSLAGLAASLSGIFIMVADVAIAAPPSVSGLFSSVRYVEEAGDLIGVEIDVHADSASPWAEFVDCQGSCTHVSRIPVILTGNRIEFEDSVPLRDRNGRSVLPLVTRYVGIFRHGVIELSVIGSDMAREKLKRAKRRYGLAVAAERDRDQPR